MISKAKSNQVPKANIDAAIERGVNGKGAIGETVKYEGMGPGNISMIIEALTDNRHRTGPAIRHLFSKHGGEMQAEGACGWLFKRVGCTEVSMANHDPIAQDKVFSSALHAGATDVEFVESEGLDGEVKPVARVTCEVEDLYAVQTQLEADGLAANVVGLVWVPKTEDGFVELNPESEVNFSDLVLALEDNDDVQEVFHNAK